MNPIPEDASPEDPRWEIAFLELAHGLVLAGAKAKIISRFTDLPLWRIRRMYRALRGTSPPPGPVMQGSARGFAIPSKRASAAWRIQCAIFLACYERLGQLSEMQVQRGWRLLDAFGVYLSLTDKLYRNTRVERLDINRAYGLLTHCGFLALKGRAELQRKECPNCLISYPVIATEPLEKQGCPVCAMNANNLRLSSQGSRAGLKNTTSKVKKPPFSAQSPP